MDAPIDTPTPSAVPTQVRPSVSRSRATSSCTSPLPLTNVGAIDRVGSHGGFLVVIGSAGLAVVAALVALPTLRAEAERAAERMADDVAASGG